jgi:hypothetical protein
VYYPKTQSTLKPINTNLLDKKRRFSVLLSAFPPNDNDEIEESFIVVCWSFAV